MSATKAQISFEFIMSMVIGMMLVVALLAMFANKLHEITLESQDQQVTAILEMLADEIDFAKGAHPGYTRIFSLPMTIDGITYSLNFSGTTIAISYLDNDFTKGFSYPINTSVCLDALDEKTQVFEVKRTSTEIILNNCPDCVLDYYDCFYYENSDLCSSLSVDEEQQCQERYCLCQ